MTAIQLAMTTKRATFRPMNTGIAFKAGALQERLTKEAANAAFAQLRAAGFVATRVGSEIRLAK